MVSLVNQTLFSAALDVLHHFFRVLVMQYIQRCGKKGLLYETRVMVVLCPLCVCVLPCVRYQLTSQVFTELERFLIWRFRSLS